MPRLKITMEEINQILEECEDRTCEKYEMDFLDDFDPEKIKNIIRQFIEVNNIC